MHRISLFSGVLCALCAVFSVVFGWSFEVAQASAHQTASSTLMVHVKPETREVDQFISVASRDLAHHLGMIEENDTPEVEQLRGAQDKLVAALSADLTVRNNGAVCEPVEEKLVMLETLAERVSFLKTVRCAENLGELVFENRVMLTSVGGYRHFGRIQLGEEVFTTVFDTKFPTYKMQVHGGEAAGAEAASAGADSAGAGAAASVSAWDVFVRYLWQGLLHILIGLDHVLFVICLLFAATNFKRLLLVVTAFTVGHSITLTISALDWFTLPDTVIEPLIALSIAYVAVEILYRRGKDVPYLYLTTLFFGLIHGFGFSYVLRDEVGLPTQALLPALFSFNAGVEIGQIAIVAVCFPLLGLVRGRSWYPQLVRVVSALILVLSVYWLVTRIFG